MGKLLGRAARLSAIGALGVGAYWSVRLAEADMMFRRDTAESVREAARLAPWSAEYQAGAAWVGEGSEEERRGALEKAVALNPRDSGAWMELGVRAETAGELGKAERCLLEAARVDKTYEPRSTLAHYYFRRGEREKVWQWVREAASIGEGELGPLFRLCWEVTEDAGLILSRAIPERAPALRQYLRYLTGTGRWEAAEGAAERIMERGEEEDAGLLLGYCDRLLGRRQGEAALRVWNSMVAKGLLGYTRLEAGRGNALTNAEFGVAPRSQGFDWRVPEVEGVSMAREEGDGSLRVSFEGKQPERCEVLWQYVALGAGRDYRFRYQYATSGIGAGSGLRWEVVDVTKGNEVAGRSGELSEEGWTEGEVGFRTADEGGVRLARVALRYERAAGRRRIKGSVWVRPVALETEGYGNSSERRR